MRYTTRPPIREPEFEIVKPHRDIHEVVIAIEETTAFPVPPPKVLVQNPTLPSFRLQAPTPPLEERPIIPASSNYSCSSPILAPQCRAASPNPADSTPRSYTSSPTLVRRASTTTTGTYSPVMRSMFPRFDPSAPLSSQQYYPHSGFASISARRAEQSGPSSSSPSLQTEGSAKMAKPDGLECGLKSVLASENLSAAVRDDLGISSPEQLVELWAIANGQKSEQPLETYKLELSCDDLSASQEIICFDSSTSQSLYTLSASGDDLMISRRHPTNETTTIQISVPTLQRQGSSSQVITSIFPKLAELMAIDQSSSVAVNCRLDRRACNELQSEAVERAYRQEACSLLWDEDSQKYYLIHPTLLDDGSPAAFPIEVSSSAGTPKEMKILAPSSTIPIIALSFETLCLEIHTATLIAYSSLYILDTLLSTTLVLLLHLHRSRCSPSLRPISPVSHVPAFDPPPTSPRTSKARKERALSSWSKTLFTRPKSRANERRTVDDEESATATIQGSPELSMTTKLPHPPQSTFQIIDPTDERLPRTTRAALKVLYWGFECLIWALGVLVNILAMAVVGIGKLIKVL